MKNIIIGNNWYDIIKWKVNLGKNEWSSALPLSIRIKMKKSHIDDLSFLMKFNNERQENDSFEDEINFKLVKEDGIYVCNSTLLGLQVLSKFPNNDCLCKIDFMIWKERKVSKESERDILLSELLKN